MVSAKTTLSQLYFTSKGNTNKSTPSRIQGFADYDDTYVLGHLDIVRSLYGYDDIRIQNISWSLFDGFFACGDSFCESLN